MTTLLSSSDHVDTFLRFLKNVAQQDMGWGCYFSDTVFLHLLVGNVEHSAPLQRG